MPEIFITMFEYLPLFLMMALLLALVQLVASIGLLKRKNWGRILFIIMMVLAILYNLGSTIISFIVMGQFKFPQEAEIPPQFENMMLAGMIMGALFTLAFCALFAAIIWKLSTPKIRAEFTGEIALS